MLTVIPAIDLSQGKAVRLYKGRMSEKTVYSDTPWLLCQEFAAAGASRIHVVDLDGAFSGRGEHSEVVGRMVRESPVPLQVGGGIRNRAALDAVFSQGAGFAVLGTAAVKNPEFAAAACRDHKGRIVIAVDARHGVVAVEGWAEGTEITARDLAVKAEGWGAAAVLYTDISRDGTGQGVNVEATAELGKGLSIPVIASGGVDSLDDVRDLGRAGVQMMVIGRALYEKHFTVAEALAAAEESSC